MEGNVNIFDDLGSHSVLYRAETVSEEPGKAVLLQQESSLARVGVSAKIVTGYGSPFITDGWTVKDNLPTGWLVWCNIQERSFVNDQSRMQGDGTPNNIVLVEGENLSEIKIDNQGLVPYSLPKPK